MILGVGIDLADRATFGHLDEGCIRRAAARWLTAAERAWCARQPELRQGLVAVLSCKEAIFKAWSAAGATHRLSLRMRGDARSGWATALGLGPVDATAEWRPEGPDLLTVAVAVRGGSARAAHRREMAALWPTPWDTAVVGGFAGKPARQSSRIDGL